MNKYSPKLDDIRARVLDTETLLHFMRDRENLQNMLDHGCPADPIRAMLDSAYNSISEANQFCIELQEAKEEDFLAEYRAAAIEGMNHAARSKADIMPGEDHSAENADAVFGSRERLAAVLLPVSPAALTEHFDTLDEIHEQSSAMLNMLMLNHRHASNGGESLADSALESYAWQLVENMKRARKAAQSLYDSLKQEAGHE